MTQTVEETDVREQQQTEPPTVHIPCCQWALVVAIGKPLYAFCGARLMATEYAPETEPSCVLCIELFAQPNPICPVRTFGS